MGFSSVIGASSVIRPGVCTSTTRPSSPFDGQVIYETDTDRLAVYDSTGWVYKTNSTAPTTPTFSFGEFVVRGGDITSPTTVASSGQTKVPLTFSAFANEITLNTTTYEWTHARTGTYKLTLTYRQDTGGDTWIQYAVKNVTPNTVVGQSVRCGTANSSQPAVWPFYYTADSTTATYALFGWSAAGPITVRHGTSGYDSISSPFSGTASHAIKVMIERVS